MLVVVEKFAASEVCFKYVDFPRDMSSEGRKGLNQFLRKEKFFLNWKRSSSEIG